MVRCRAGPSGRSRCLPEVDTLCGEVGNERRAMVPTDVIARVATPLRVRAVRDGLSVLGVIALAWTVLYAPSADVHAYWAFTPGHPYGADLGYEDAFLYSPVIALLVLPFHALPFALVRLLLMAADVACLLYLAGPWAFAVLALPPVFADVGTGNIHILLATAIALGFRYPASWSLVVLSKVSPGVGLLWFAVRREWRSLATALGVTGALALGSLVLVPAWWPEWFGVLSSSTRVTVTAPLLIDAPLALRVLAGAVIVAWGARANRPWTVSLAAMVALPEVWVIGAAVLLGALPEARRRHLAGQRRAEPGPVAVRAAVDREAARRSSPGEA